MPVQHLAGDRIVLTHARGASVELLLYGATVISWKTGTRANPDLVERLFVSGKAALDGSKPVRGGIPIVFPCFGAPSHREHARLSQHGFARSQTWTFDRVIQDDDKGVSVRLTLGVTPSIEAVYDRTFELGYVVALEEHRLGTDLQVTNTSGEALEFQALLHNYIRAPADEAVVSALTHTRYYDKTETSEEGRNTAKTETRAEVDVRTFTDAVYEDAPERYAVTWRGGGVAMAVSGFKDVVVWNPQQAVSDMEDGGWKRYVCVEPGHVRGFARVAAGGRWAGRQLFSLV